jgi:hypothetical protein
MFSEFDMEIEELLTPNAKIIRSPRKGSAKMQMQPQFSSLPKVVFTT